MEYSFFHCYELPATCVEIYILIGNINIDNTKFTDEIAYKICE